jgi:hypothetical protein
MESIFVQAFTITRDIAAVSIQLYFAKGFGSLDPSLDLWEWILMAQITQSISIITSCVPYLRPFLESLSAGLVPSESQRQRSGGSSRYNYYNPSAKQAPYSSQGQGNTSSVLSATNIKAIPLVFAPESGTTATRTNREWLELENCH